MLQNRFFIFNVSVGNFPNLGGPFNHLLFHALSGVVAGPTCLEGYAAASGVRGEADAVSIADLGLDVSDGKTQHLGHVHGHGCSAATDVR